MKKILLYVLCFFFIIGSGLAANISSSDSVDLDLTTANQTATKSFTITPDAALTNIVVSFTNAVYNVTFSTDNVNYASTLNIANLGIAKTLYVKVLIPNTEEQGIRTIGNIRIAATELPSPKEIPVKENVRGLLNIGDLDAKMGKEDANNLNDGDKINKVLKPGDSFEFNIKIENNFEKDTKIDMNNIVVTATISGIDDGSDLDEESEEFDLNPREDKTLNFKFITPIAVEEGDYGINIFVEGKDDNGVKRIISWDLSLEVAKESHDVVFYSYSLNPTKITCSGTYTLSTTLYNFGRNNEEDVKLVIKNSDLGINIEDYPIDLSSDLLEDTSKYSKTYSFSISKNQKAGTFPIEAWLYYSVDVLDDYRKLELVVESCPVEEKKEPVTVAVCGNNKLETGEECDDGNTVNGDGCSADCKKEAAKEETPITPSPVTGTVITETKEEPLSISWILLLVGVNVLVLVIVIVLIFLMFKGRKEEGEEEEKVYKNF